MGLQAGLLLPVAALLDTRNDVLREALATLGEIMEGGNSHGQAVFAGYATQGFLEGAISCFSRCFLPLSSLYRWFSSFGVRRVHHTHIKYSGFLRLVCFCVCFCFSPAASLFPCLQCTSPTCQLFSLPAVTFSRFLVHYVSDK